MHVLRSWLVLLGIAIALVMAAHVQAQTVGTIKGLVIDQSSQHPLQFVNVAVHRNSDSTIVTGQVTDSTGRFRISGVSEGEYYITPRIIGYKQKRTASFRIDAGHKDEDVGRIVLEPTNILMHEVEVSAEKLLYSTSIDRKVYNVDRDLMSKSGSASELLQNVPSVQVDIDGNVSLRGSTDVLIMVNGRTSPMMRTNSATALEQLPANSIERIEVITNPTAEFKPDAAAGIINIVLKKDKTPGINGSVIGNAGNSNRYNSTALVNYNPGKVNVYGSYAIRRNNRDRYGTDDRDQVDTSFAFYHQSVNSHARPLSHTISGGLEYHPGAQQQFGVSGSYFYNNFDRNELADNYLYDNTHALTSYYQRNRLQSQVNKETSVTAFYQRDFAKEDHSLRVEFTGSRSPEVEDNHFTNVYKAPVAPNSFDKSLLKDGENTNEFTLEYSNPVSDEVSIKAGYSAEFNTSDFDFAVDNFDTTEQIYVTDTTKTNRFRHYENIQAAYGTYKRAFGKFGVVAGLRGEYAYISSNLVNQNSKMSNSYTNLYPSLHLAYELGKPTELQLSYSKRTRRPETEDLNPFPEYTDPHNIRAGNPKLLPEYIHLVELGCQYRSGGVTLVPALFYRYTMNRFTWVTTALNDTVFLTKHENLSSDQAEGLEVNVSASAQKLVSLHGTASLFRNQIDASDLTGVKETVTNWSSNLTADLSLSETTKLQLSSNYRSSQLIAQGKTRPSYMLNAGFRQELAGGKLIFLATITDIFHTMKREFIVNTATLQETTLTRMDSRVVYAGLTYHFGAQPKKSREEQIHYDDNQ